MTASGPARPQAFDEVFRASFRDLVLWRRDVRRFRTDPVEPSLVRSLLELATHAPSVGNCQPWRFVIVSNSVRRGAVRDSYERANAQALSGYCGETRTLYARLKLAGLDAAPVHIAVFADETTERGLGLGRQTMPETVRYSAVGAIHTLWLAARAEGLGLGWISILEPEVVSTALEVPETWTFLAYLCLGWPEEEHLDPELVRYGWEARAPLDELILER
ncbi:MAG: 5,6-dimethylbenzimidazole synthase [Hyphomicrobium sp.]|jgi:5,6-dimethylbenzimidazole synthase